ncbi:MAG TPA: DISARM system SNF2-like helicase DrmD [Streptosporangiaceae bacterium]|nr:DISARM system SNF2-like helicase DrmD [Streptosporangiaceae bacterium]
MDVLRDSAGVPASGQLVTVRNRQWVASDVTPGTVASGSAAVMTGQVPHVVTLVSIEDDARDERLRVVWELERGALAHDQHALPDPGRGFDDPGQLDAFLDAVRWGAIASADKTVLQAPFRSGIQIDDYQLDPVVRALSMPRTNLLIADDVGLGKTIEAGLVMQELMLRYRARTMLIVCPAGLTLQWHDEMRDKFGLDFRIVDTALLRDLRRSRGLYANPWTHYPRLIVSIDWLKRERPMRLLRDVLPQVPKYPRAFDLLVVDEVHTCAPTARADYAVDSLRTQAVRALAPHCEHRLFLSATPHNGYLESFTALLELLDDQRFARGVCPSETQLAKIMVRRLKRDLPPKWDGTPRFARRVTGYLEVDHSPDERSAHRMLAEYAASRRAGARGDGGRAAADFITTLLKKRMFSSPKAFAETVETHLATMTARSSLDQAAGSSGTRILRPLIDRLEETAEDDAAYGQREADALSTVRRITAPLTPAERDLLVRLGAWARQAQDRPNAKLTAFRQWLDPIVRPGNWSGERVIVFTEYRDTQRWLYERLIGGGIPAERIAQLYGGQDQAERERIKSVFQEKPELDPVRILLATDAASEGINLQAHCHRLLHWEIPWNPNRLEQRNGRIDRHGQHAAEVEVFHFVPTGWEGAESPGAVRHRSSGDDSALDDELYFLWVAVKKVDQIREDLGSAGEVIEAQIAEKMLGKRSDWQSADVEIRRRASNAELKINRDLVKELEKLTGTLAESRGDLNLSPHTVERVVRTALRIAHHKDLDVASPPDEFRGQCFRLPDLPGAWGEARNDGLYHPVTGKERPITFDHDAAAERTDVVLLHLGHRLVQMCLRLLRAELWSDATTAPERHKLSRVTARVVPGDVLRVPAVAGHIRVVVTGAEGTRLHEEIVVAGGTIEAGRLVRATEDDLRTWLGMANEELPDEPVRQRLTELWPELSPPLRGILANRASARRRSLAGLIAARCTEEVAAMNAILDELTATIRAALDDTQLWQQGSLFEIDAERDQLRKDREALVARLESIPQTREQETAALRRRYDDPQARWFPAAITFLVPSTIAYAGGGG